MNPALKLVLGGNGGGCNYDDGLPEKNPCRQAFWGSLTCPTFLKIKPKVCTYGLLCIGGKCWAVILPTATGPPTGPDENTAKRLVTPCLVGQIHSIFFPVHLSHTFLTAHGSIQQLFSIPTLFVLAICRNPTVAPSASQIGLHLLALYRPEYCDFRGYRSGMIVKLIGTPLAYHT
jgi:hypothetical protein